MALSGNYHYYPTSSFGLYVEWTATQSVTGNYSNVTQKIYLSYYTLEVGARDDGKSSINGTQVTYSTASIYDYSSGWKKKLLYTHTVKVNHNSDGTKTGVALSASWRFSGTYSGVSIGTITASTTISLDKIDRTAPTVTHSTSNITANGFKISASSSVTADIWEYSTNGGSSYTQFSTTAGTSANVTLTNLSPNTSYSVRVRARKKSNQVYGYSTAASTKTLGGSVVTSASNCTIDAETVTLNFKLTIYEASYYHKLNVKNGSTTVFSVNLGQYAAGTSVSKTYTLTASQRTSMLNQIPNATSFTATIEIVTYSNSGYSTQIGSASSKTATMSTSSTNSKPTFTDFTYGDTRATVVAATEDDQVLVQSYSWLEVNAVAGTAKNGASISSYSVEIGNVSKTSGTTWINVGTVASKGTLTLKVTCIDSRGYSTSVSKSVKVLEYTKPKVSSYTLRRKDEIEDIIQLEFRGSFSPLKADGSTDTNSLKFAGYYYKRTDQSAWSSWISIKSDVTVTNNSFSFSTVQLMVDSTTALSLDSDYSWDFHLLIRDELDYYASYDLYVTIPQGTPLISLRKRNSRYDFPRVGINNPTPTAPLDVGGDIVADGVNILNTIIYRSGNTQTLDSVISSGFITSSQTKVYFCIPMPKSMANVTPTFTSLTISARTVSGTYLWQNVDVLSDSTLSVALSKSTECMLRVIITSTAALSATNNTPLAVTLSGTVSFA